MTALRRRALLALAPCSLATGAAHAGTMFPSEPADYRQAGYGAPTPATLVGASVISTAAAHGLWQAGQAAFIDVLPQAPRPAGLPADTLWRDKPHFDIPNSIWLPDTGYGRLAPAMQEYLRQGLRRAQAGVPGRLLVIYCKPQCWMSWNAAKRALALGFAPVAWYPDGAAGWQSAGYPVELRTPETRP